MESIIQQLGNLDILPVFVNLSHTIAQPFIHSFQAVVPGFIPCMKSLVANEPGLIGGVFFVLLSYSFVVLVQNSKKARVVVTNKKPSLLYREGFPSGLNSEERV
jgi:hypothetical protein